MKYKNGLINFNNFKIITYKKEKKLKSRINPVKR